jgi:signal transduction histidine kinase
MSLRTAAGRLIHGLRHPQTTVRWRLTLLYGGLFLVSGAALLTITYTLVDHATVRNGPFRDAVQFTRGSVNALPAPGPLPSNVRGRTVVSGPNFAQVKAKSVPRPVQQLLRSKAGREAVLFLGSDQRVSDLHQLVVESVIALAVMAIISTLLGWLVAGRVFSPLRTMTAATQEISEANLHERLAMEGPPDELRHLADTIDGLLGRLEGAFNAQRSFVANASHELRTPLTAARALLELVISDPKATVASFRSTCRQVLEESEQQEQLINALLALAQGQRGIDRPARVDLPAVTDVILKALEPEVGARGLELTASLEAAVLSGDSRLISRLVSNLVDNALRHNLPGGRVSVNVLTHEDQAILSVSNTGPPVPPDQVPRLLQPFQRLTPERAGHHEGHGLGLSIVSAIADTHRASLEIHARPGGGLDVEVHFPPVPHDDPQALKSAPGADPAVAEDRAIA